MSCASCTSLLQLGLSLSVQAQRLDRESRAIAAGTTRELPPRAERLADYDRRLAAWQASVREHLEQHQGEARP